MHRDARLRRPTPRCATPRCSSACSTKTSACSGRSGSTAWRTSTSSGSTSTWSGSARPTPGGSKTEGRLNPTLGLLFGAAAILGAGPARLQRGRAPAARAGVGRWCWSRRWSGLIHPIARLAQDAPGDPPGQPLGRGHLRVPRAQARAPPARAVPSSSRRSATGSRFENVTLESRLGAGVLLEGRLGRVPGRARGRRS